MGNISGQTFCLMTFMVDGSVNPEEMTLCWQQKRLSIPCLMYLRRSWNICFLHHQSKTLPLLSSKVQKPPGCHSLAPSALLKEDEIGRAKAGKMICVQLVREEHPWEGRVSGPAACSCLFLHCIFKSRPTETQSLSKVG